MTKLLKETTPMMKQWQACKKDAGDALLLFRLGDFYEAFFEDAEKLSSALMIALTKRADIPMAGIPVQSIENYLDKLMESGICVALAEQIESPKDVKGIVKRQVTRILTPATYTAGKDQNSGSNNFLLCISHINKTYAISYIDTSTSEFFTSAFSSADKMADEILRIGPKEILICKKLEAKSPKFLTRIQSQIRTKFVKIEPLYFDHSLCIEKLHSHLNVASLDGFGLKGETAAVNACGALFTYLETDIFFDISAIKSLQKRDTSKHLAIDHAALSHLEIFHSTSGFSLFNIINHTNTPGGQRLLKSTLYYPLMDKDQIIKRQEYIKELLAGNIELKGTLSGIKDIERLITKIATRKARPEDLLLLANSLDTIPNTIDELKGTISDVSCLFTPLRLTKKLLDTISIENSEYFISYGINEKLDELKDLEKESSSHLKAYEERCKEDLGIKNLKVGQSRSFGYYIEISRKSAHIVPETYTRRQTLVNGERYITDELKKLESAILSAKSEAMAIEQQILSELIEECICNQKAILQSANIISKIDLLHSLKTLALENGYICPEINEDGNIDITEGSHPILLKIMNEETFIPNDIHLNNEESLAILTGPNMAGKSTYIKSVALLSILTQIGSFIPAKKASISIVDKIFTRIGALDDLQRGQSTFMVEMTETANILRNATEKSLIILDEIGRGTGTTDGIAIAQSIACYIAEHISAKTLFATHYLELTELSSSYPQIKNIRSTVLEDKGAVTFLHKIEDGKAFQSYGIFVGELAGLPRKVILDAKEHLLSLSSDIIDNSPKKTPRKNVQFNLFQENPSDPILEEIKKLEIDHLTPFEALTKLIQWKKTLI